MNGGFLFIDEIWRTKVERETLKRKIMNMVKENSMGHTQRDEYYK